MSATQPVRRRDAGATREAILASARLAFIRWGYDGAGVREIAEGAGVTAMLVNRYFGSRKRLFSDFGAGRMAAPGILPGELTAPNLVFTGCGCALPPPLTGRTITDGSARSGAPN